MTGNPNKAIVELSLQAGGCIVNCDYCPQDMIWLKYHGNFRMGFESIDCLCKTIPEEIPFCISGSCEPFLHPNCTDRMQQILDSGHGIEYLFTTLTGATVEDAKRVCEMDIKDVMIHLPDPKQYAKIPNTKEYPAVLNYMVRNCPNLNTMSMRDGGYFITNHREDFAHGKFPSPIRGRKTCPYLKYRKYFVYPNGDTYICCVLSFCLGKEGYLGNIYKEGYAALAAKFDRISMDLQTRKDSVCHCCPHALPYWPIWFFQKFIKDNPLVPHIW